MFDLIWLHFESHTSDTYGVSILGTVTGWGATAEYGATSKVLREVNVPIISNDDCRKTKYGNKITANMMCAGFVGKGAKDACQVIV